MTSMARLVLSPVSPRGWFGGRAVLANRPCDARSGVTLQQAAEELARTFGGEGAALTAVLACYDGSCTVVSFSEATGLPAIASPTCRTPLLQDARWDLRPEVFRAAVSAVRERIAAGDVYVLNLTARLTGALAVASPEEAHARLQLTAAAEMGALFTGLPGPVPWIASASPERFLKVVAEGGVRTAEIAPIKGTRPRGVSEEADLAIANELACDEKERAEHLMVVDLERNDLGMVAVPGSVRVEGLYEVVATPYCHQMVSTVRATLRADATFAELLGATFPCGSVTGAPKRAAMRIAAELEATPRGAYCGALLVAVPGELDSSVLIRTLEGIAEQPGHARWGAGGGITYDSDPAAEHLEVLLKASPATGDAAPATALRETMRVVRGQAPLLDRHLARLSAGGVGPTLLAKVRAEVARQLAAADSGAAYARLAITVTPDGSVAAGLSGEPSSLAVEGGPRITLVEVADEPPLPAGAAKPASRRYWDRPHRAARMAGADQAVLHLPDGTLVDGSTATVWLVIDGQLATPPAPPAVAGVARGLVFDVAAQLGIHAEARPLALADLEAANEVFLSNGVGLAVAVRGRGGPVTARITEAVWRPFGGYARGTRPA